MTSRKERIEGGLIGLLVGDALGVPYEFHPPESIPPTSQIEMVPPDGFRRAHGGVKPGTWSDDGAQALCLLASLLDNDGLDVDDLGQRMVRWRERGYMAVDERVFDIGIGTASALGRISRGVKARDAGGAGERENGNGSLMRVLPLVLWHRGTDAELVELAQLQSLPTHRHPRSLVCCALYCLWARGVLEARDEPWATAVALLEEIYSDDAEKFAELTEHVQPHQAYECRGTGYVVDCLRSAQRVVAEPSYEAAVRSSVALGNDTDTTACVAGGVAGIIHGVSEIPERWRDALRGREVVVPLLERLLDRSR